MPSWRISSRSSHRSSGSTTPPPRYSALSQPTPPDTHSGSHSADEAVDNSDSHSIASLTSRTALPTYTSNVDLTRLSILSPSMTTLSRPPQYYSGVPQNTDGPDEDHDSMLKDSEYAFTIRGGFKSTPWATLRLYDAEIPASRASRKGPKRHAHPRFSNLDKMVGNVELSLTSPQTIKTIELVLKGTLITGASEHGGSVSFLEHKYTLWDRKFGDPRHLSSSNRPSHNSMKYDGKLSGDWIFPFAIPFPTHVDLATRSAVHATGSEGPVRFLPEFQDPTVTPFRLGGSSGSRAQSVVYEQQSGGGSTETVTPFDTANQAHFPTGKTDLGHSRAGSAPILSSRRELPPPTAPGVSPIPPQEIGAPTTPSLEPYTLTPHERTGNPTESDYPTKGRPLRPPPGPQQRSRGTDTRVRQGASSMSSELNLPLTTTSHRLPQTFLERDVMANVHYELCLLVTHGSLFTTESRVKSPITYTPTSAPPPTPLQRQISLRQRTPPRSPDLDPSTWTRLPSPWIRGVYLDQHTVAVKYTLYLALPLSYARGTYIPCALSIACQSRDSDPAAGGALGFFANPRTPRVRLRRLVWFAQSEEPTASIPADRFKQGDAVRNTANATQDPQEIIEPFTGPEEVDDDIVDEKNVLSPDEADNRIIGDGAVWCKPEQYVQEPHVRRLYGEIRLPRGVQPTSAFPMFKVLYRVELLAPATGAFVPDAVGTLGEGRLPPPPHLPGSEADEKVYASRYVEVTTDGRRDEPTPVPLVGHALGKHAPVTNGGPNFDRYTPVSYTFGLLY